MKKFFATMLTIIVSSAFAGNLVYDYKASIKRIDAVYSVKKINKVQYVTDAYKTTSDTIIGYIVLPACATCVDDDDAIKTDYTALEDWKSENSNVGYFIRKGDKLSKKKGINLPFIAKTDVEASAGMFGAYTPTTGAGVGKPYADVKANKYAWMALSFTIPASKNKVDSGNVLKKYAGEDLNYGFLGFDNINEIEVQNAGFGKTKIVTEAAKLGFCGGKPGSSCQIVFSISGSTIGEAEYQGPCGVTPMWDVCYTESKKNEDGENVEVDADEYVLNEATIHGTWTLKYNNKLSAVDDDEKEKEILKKLGGTLDDVYVDEGDDDDDDDDDDSDDTPSDDTPSDDTGSDDTGSDDTGEGQGEGGEGQGDEPTVGRG